MDRRFLTVLVVSLVFALVVSSVFYQMTARAGSAPKQASSVELKDVVVATRALPVGVLIKPGDVKIVKWPVEQYPATGFGKDADVLERPVVSPILANDVIVEGRLAPRNTGIGIAPQLGPGMRAVSVRVNDEVSVAGWVLPGMRVDILVTGRPPQGETSMTSTVLQNIQVLSVGATAQPDSKTQTISAPTVTLLVTPQQAEILTLAGNEGRIKLVLRNGTDNAIEATKGSTTAELYGGARGRTPAAPRADREAPVRRPAPIVRPVPVMAMAPPPPPPPPAAPEIVVFRGSQRTVEAVPASRGN